METSESTREKRMEKYTEGRPELQESLEIHPSLGIFAP
jgi:hypothetical protein